MFKHKIRIETDTPRQDHNSDTAGNSDPDRAWRFQGYESTLGVSKGYGSIKEYNSDTDKAGSYERDPGGSSKWIWTQQRIRYKSGSRLELVS